MAARTNEDAMVLEGICQRNDFFKQLFAICRR